MTELPVSADSETYGQSRRQRVWQSLVRRGSRSGLEIAVCLFAVLALATPFRRIEVQGRLGLLLVLSAGCEVAHGFRRSTAAGQSSAWSGGAITLCMGLLLINAPNLAASALLIFLAGWFGLDGLRHLAGARRQPDRNHSRSMALVGGLGNLAVAALLLLVRGPMTAWALAIAAFLRMIGTAANMAQAPVFTARDSGESVIANLNLTDNPELLELANQIAVEETARSAIDRGWIVGFMATLFAIHVGRMGFDRTFLGIFSPGFAVLGDVCVALLLAFVVVMPTSIVFYRLTRGAERRVWSWCLVVPDGRRGRIRKLTRFALISRLRRMIRLSQARYSFRTALSRGLQIGLPLAAVIAATIPVWGMSWYFDTENWASGVWNNWAEERTDTWREAMIEAVLPQEAGKPFRDVFAVTPTGIEPGKDFSFLVIGDTGEGDASQLSLKAQFLEVVRRPDVRFVVISSDVVYPVGAMRDYETKFWLPFMGTTKPVYAIPGNHDWYDALEGFAATFLEPDAARTVMRARVEADLKLASTTDRHIERLIAEAGRLNREYGVPTGFQQGPFFQFQTDRFALFAVDTGVRKRVDEAQLAWFRSALGSARGKLKMAILGHPLYACGEYRARDNDDFAAVHALLRRHDVRIVMAGDTHDLEYYVERRSAAPPVYHFVNGGGGAFLTMGVQLLRDRRFMPSDEWAFYPPTAPLVAKIEAHNAFWKVPLWWWTRELEAWPSAPEWLSAAFDYNVAPFFQSFFEVRVEPSTDRVRLRPWGVHGRLRWSDLQASPGIRPEGIPADDPIEWTFDLPPAPAAETR